MLKVDGKKVKDMMRMANATANDLVRCGVTLRELDRALRGDSMTERTVNKVAKAIGVGAEKLVA